MAIFERRHYQVIAKIIESVWNDRDPGIESEAIAHKLADRFSQDNPNFSRERFLKACGMEDA
ncbi:hypothetical protein LCGC14_1632790 [marine sediment metagenome]|uniref:Uncharacterized protein n=1 Tax=marine sediment metagenome TaxID=412755 RepID=A0A0F9I256_9ZZZZ